MACTHYFVMNLAAVFLVRLLLSFNAATGCATLRRVRTLLVTCTRNVGQRADQAEVTRSPGDQCACALFSDDALRLNAGAFLFFRVLPRE